MSSTILARAWKRHAYIVFVDESGFMLGPLRRHTWAPRGCTPVIKITSPHERISVIGAITISPRYKHFGFQFCLSEDNANFHGDGVVRFVDALRRRLRGPMTILWDTIRIHLGRPVELYLASHRTMVVEPFPPYAPELNPVNYVWSYVKYGRLPNYCPPDLSHLRRSITAEFRRLQKRPKLLESLFRRAGLPLDPQ
jgi:putative transposase